MIKYIVETLSTLELLMMNDKLLAKYKNEKRFATNLNSLIFARF